MADNVPATASGSGAGFPANLGAAAGFSNLGLFRQLGLMIGLAASVAIGFAVVLWSQEPAYRPLLSELSGRDASSIVETLTQNQIPYRIDTNSGALLVPAEHLYQARMQLAANNLTGQDTLGFEILDQEQALGTSQFMESIRYRRGLEGELARTISSLLAVKSARVHLAIPKPSVFIRDARDSKASVFLELFAGRRLEPEQIASIANLVASSISALDPKDVTVVDQKGRLLNSQEIDDQVAQAAKQLDYVRRVEERLADRVRGILTPVVGAGSFRAEVSADIDFTAVEQTDELYNPDLPAVRSEQIVSERRSGAGLAEGIPGALSNQPPGAATAPEVAGGEAGGASRGGSASDVRREVRNYEVDRTISYTRNHQGRVKRLTVAVAVDDVRRPNADTGELETRQWSENELRRLTLLVRDAVGYSAARGDSVNVVNTPFATEEAPQPLPEVPIWEESWFWDLMKKVGAGLFLLILVFGVLRPIMKNLSASGASKEGGEGLGGELEGIEETELPGVPQESADDMLPTANESYERQVEAVRSLVAQDPGRVAQVVKQWIASDE